MHSIPSSHHGSADNMESITEIFHGKYFPVAESCPLRIDVNRVPFSEEAPPRLGTTRKSNISRATGRIILPEIGSRVSGKEGDHLINSEQELQELDSSYMSCYRSSTGSKIKSSAQQFDYTGPSLCQTDFDNFIQQSLEVVLERREEKMEEANALKRWEFWMKDKRRMQEYLCRRLQKSSTKLLIQDSDKIRRKLEDRWLNTCTQIPEPDKWRGHPFRWKAEFRLPNRKIRWNEPKSGSPPQYCAIRTSLDKGEIPDTEFIGIPQTVQKEKGFVYKHSFETHSETNPEDTQYFMCRRRQLKPHDIDMDGLEVIGKKIIQPQETPEPKRSHPDLPEIIVHGATDYNKCEEDPSIFCLVIGNEVIKYEMSGRDAKSKIPTRSFHWQVDFPLNTVGALAERDLRVENRGTVAIRYYWLSEKPEKPMNLEKLQPRQYEPWFFFNKNSGFFLPGQIYHLKFYHHSKFSGLRKEVWHLKTEPPLSLSSEPCTVTLSAIATEEISRRNPLERYLFNRVKTSIAESVIEIIIDKVVRPSPLRGIEYRSLFFDNILFWYNNPKRYYNSTIVNGLNKLYEEIASGPADWDLSIDTLVSLVKAQRIGKERNAILLQVSKQARLLLKPTYVSVSQNKKYRMAYGILCKMANFMEEDFNLLRGSVYEKINLDLKKHPTSAEENSNASVYAGEYGEFDYYNIVDFDINPVNFMFFKTLFYIKVYYRICEAVENIAGMIETRKLFEPWREINYKAEKPQRKNEHPYVPDFTEFE